jgi:hypothetical protein
MSPHPLLGRLDAIAYDTRWAPRSGWHDDHRGRDGTPAYLPAVQQVRAEFLALAEVLEWHDATAGRALQLGWGECGASHEMLRNEFRCGAVTLDWKGNWRNENREDGGDIHSRDSIVFAQFYGPYSFLFCDAGHTYDAVARDFSAYYPMVVSGGVVAFHDSLPREGYREVEVWRFLAGLEEMRFKVNRIGSEVGIAWIVKGDGR